jgi:uncharacterized protein YjbI with pentapeptide repeats
VLEPHALTAFDPDEELYGVVITELDPPPAAVRRWGVNGSRFEGVDLGGAELPVLGLVDCEFVQCGLANVQARDASLRRIAIESSRLTGLQLMDAQLEDVALRGCRADMASFFGAQLERVTFVDCVLGDADFRGAKLTDVAFVDCDVRAADFAGTRFESCELRGTPLDGVSGIETLAGVSMSWADIVANAGAFATALGVRVLDGDD